MSLFHCFRVVRSVVISFLSLCMLFLRSFSSVCMSFVPSFFRSFVRAVCLSFFRFVVLALFRVFLFGIGLSVVLSACLFCMSVFCVCSCFVCFVLCLSLFRMFSLFCFLDLFIGFVVMVRSFVRVFRYFVFA